MLSKKDVIEINREFHSGKIVNEGSLDYAIETTKRSKNWLKSAAVIVRAILADHVFEDGNKRTAAAVMMAYLDINNLGYNQDKVGETVVRMLKDNVTNLKKIERLIKNAIE